MTSCYPTPLPPQITLSINSVMAWALYWDLPQFFGAYIKLKVLSQQYLDYTVDFNGLNSDGSFTTAVSNSFLSLLEKKNPIASD